MGDISGDDVIAAVTYRNAPNAYYYEVHSCFYVLFRQNTFICVWLFWFKPPKVAEAGPRHLKVIYYNGYVNQKNDDSYYYY